MMLWSRRPAGIPLVELRRCPGEGKARGWSFCISSDELGRTGKSACATSGTATPGCSPKRISQPTGSMSPAPQAEFTVDSGCWPDFCFRSHRQRRGRDQTQITRGVAGILSHIQNFLRKNKAFSQDLLPGAAPL
jgi:hypothetical protein